MADITNEHEGPTHSPAITPQINYPVNFSLEGKLPNNKRIKGELSIVIDFENDEYIVSEPEYHIHGSGVTRDQAISAFSRILFGIYDELEEESDHLGKHMKEQLAYLQTKLNPSFLSL